ncbi:MAG TPA: FG-GAP-like repeat-containing protein, partial [Planctomycetota bacterium]|nr:FG-GAP-like repeat-containing protein [Planctomycetota bacterium]
AAAPQAARVPPLEAVLLRFDGDEPGDWFGYSVAAVGDFDGDGVGDLAVGAHQNTNGFEGRRSQRAGYARVHSGADGALLARFTSRDARFPNTTDGHFGISLVACADTDGDGARELFVGSYLHDAAGQSNSGALFRFSGLDPEPSGLAYGWRGGNRLGFALDLVRDRDGDGVADVLAGAPKEDRWCFNGGTLRVFSSRTLEELLCIDGASFDGQMGSAAATVGDVDGDGFDDLAGGAPYADRDEHVPPAGALDLNSGAFAGHADEGQVLLVSGADGATLACWFGGERGDALGWSVAGAGDLDGDGVPDLAAGAVQSDYAGGFRGAGYVRAWSVRDGRELFTARGDTLGDQFGWSVAAAGDLDGDGIPDLFVGAPGAVTVSEPLGRPGRLYVLSGRDGSRLAGSWGLEVDDQFGTAVTLVHDLDGDGVRDVLVGAPSNVPGQTRPGYAVVLSGAWLLGAP